MSSFARQICNLLPLRLNFIFDFQDYFSLGARPKVKSNFVSEFESMNITNGNVDNSIDKVNGNIEEVRSSDANASSVTSNVAIIGVGVFCP